VIRFLLMMVANVVLYWLVRASWPAPLPFVVGGAIAYIVLPVVNALDRVMPRLVAAVITVALVIALLVGTVALLARVVALELYDAYQALPESGDIEAVVADFDEYLATLPDPIERFVRAQVETSAIELRERVSDRVDRIDHPLRTVFFGVVNAIGLALGLLVLPVWLLLVLRDQQRAVDAMNRALPDWLEADFWGVVRIVNRVLGAYLRRLVIVGLVVGVATATGLAVIDSLGLEGVRYPIALGLLAAFLELVPIVGPIIAAIVLVAITAVHSPTTGIVVLGLIVAIRILVRNQIASRIERRVIDVHPVLLIVAIAALSQFGLVWALLAAPVVVITRDLFRYTWGRFSDPPRPAGLLPGEAVPSQPRDVVTNTPVPRVPLVYQRIRPRVP